MATTPNARPSPLLDYRSGEGDEPVSQERPGSALLFTILASGLTLGMAVAVLSLIVSYFNRAH